jgi:hypothetical protein
MAFNTFRFIFIPIFLSAFIAEASEYSEKEARKIDYVLQLTKFIQWPAISLVQLAPIELCLFATTPAKSEWEKMKLRKSQNRDVHLQIINQDNQLSQCHILFVHKGIPNSVIKKNYYLLASNNILTIGEKKNFAKDGGIIELHIDEDKVDIKINTQTATEAKININANLIELASSVYSQRHIQ